MQATHLLPPDSCPLTPAANPGSVARPGWLRWEDEQSPVARGSSQRRISMFTARLRSVGVLAAVALLGAAWLNVSALGADDEAALRRRALALNDVTGEDTI